MSILWRTGCLVLAMMVVANQLALAEESAAKPADAPPAPAGEEASTKPLPTVVGNDLLAGFPIHGFLRSRYIARWSSGAGDQDLVETLSLDAGDPERNRVTAHFLGDISVDFDGNTNVRGFNTYDSARDSTGSAIVPRVYSGYLDFNRVGVLSILRVGRQSIYETPEISYFDGVRAETKELGGNRVKLGAYGGVTVRQYEDYTPRDLLGGAYLEGHLWHGSRARVDYQHLEGHKGQHEFQNNLIGFGGWQSLGQYVDLHAHYTRLDDEGRDVLVRGTFNQPDWDFHLQASYYQLLQTRQNAVIGADAYYPILKDYFPYRDYRWMASKGFGDHVNVDAGMDLRRLANENQESTYNHRYDRYFATLDLLDLAVKGSSISLTEERWVSPGRHTESQGLDVTCPVGAKNKVSAGTAHYLYKYDYYSDQERDDVQDYYLKFEHKCSRALRASLEYDFEHDGSSGHYNELRCEAICTF